MIANWRHWSHLIALRTVRDLYLLAAIELLAACSWLDRHPLRRR